MKRCTGFTIVAATYVKTTQGWRFKSRSVLTPQELAARGGAAK